MLKRRYLVVLLFLGTACGGRGDNSSEDVFDAQAADVATDSPADSRKTDGALLPDCLSDLHDEQRAPSTTPAKLAAGIDGDAYWSDLSFIAQERPPGSAHWQAVQDLCSQRFTDLGFDVELQDYGTGVNVIGVRPGLELPEEHVIVSAHYDHILDCPGADDNGTGVAGVLETARALATADFRRSLVVACWDEEELGLKGSSHYAVTAKLEGMLIVESFVYEMIGYTDDAPDSQGMPFGFDLIFPQQAAWAQANEMRGDFVAFISDLEGSHGAIEILHAHSENVGLPALAFELNPTLMTEPALGDLHRSDHSPFWYNGYPAIMVTDTSNFRNPYYHCHEGVDSIDTLDRDFAVAVTRTVTAAAAELLHVL